MLPPSRSTQRIAVVGAGIMGLGCAIALRRRGRPVTLIDYSEAMDAPSWGNAGHIATEQAEPLASPAQMRSAWRRRFGAGGPLSLPAREIVAWLPFVLLMAMSTRRHKQNTAALKSLIEDALPAWRRLAGTIGAPELLREKGHFVAWESKKSAARGRAAWEAADTGSASFREANDKELAQLRTLAPIADAIRFSGTAQIASLPALAAALSACFQSIGGERVTGEATLRAGPGGATLQIDGAPFDAENILVTAGIASGRLLEAVGHRVPLIAERGYHIEGPAPDWPEAMPPIVFEDRSIIATRFASGLRLASFVEFARASSPGDPAKWRRLVTHAEALGLPLGTGSRRWMGARPTLPDYLPAIGTSARMDNLTYAFGHNHLGLTLAAITAEHVADILTGAPARIDLTPFSLARFGAPA